MSINRKKALWIAVGLAIAWVIGATIHYEVGARSDDDEFLYKINHHGIHDQNSPQLRRGYIALAHQVCAAEGRSDIQQYEIWLVINNGMTSTQRNLDVPPIPNHQANQFIYDSVHVYCPQYTNRLIPTAGVE
ncbi:DUF732 domain-containing protein [Mycolicibacter kumamotonensis]|uniref:DUF732 domain-containing protein n=1 Tax=Mycolicibacter kumamotonensis TaxID=354243 RepID=A0A1B8SL86_9MYCO|nr:DUF732 domain-containing protein [Mycolicibacter kumamotonensis]OBY33453.1 hypothetical protein ACT18_00435 [Mycolicibacter kumamotonensis]